MVKKKKQLKKKTSSIKRKSIKKNTKKVKKKKKTIRKSKTKAFFELADGYKKGTLTEKEEYEFWYLVNRGRLDHPNKNKLWDIETQKWKNKQHPIERFLMGLGAITAIFGIYSLLALINP